MSKTKHHCNYSPQNCCKKTKLEMNETPTCRERYKLGTANVPYLVPSLAHAILPWLDGQQLRPWCHSSGIHSWNSGTNPHVIKENMNIQIWWYVHSSSLKITIKAGSCQIDYFPFADLLFGQINKNQLQTFQVFKPKHPWPCVIQGFHSAATSRRRLSRDSRVKGSRSWWPLDNPTWLK